MTNREDTPPPKAAATDTPSGTSEGRRRLSLALEDLHPTEERPELALLLVDLDRFKQVNDVLGHRSGDKLLDHAADRLAKAAGKNCENFRLGADEYAVLYSGTETATVATERIARRIVDLLGRPFLIDGQQINVGASIGISVFNSDTDMSSEMLLHADLALHNAKKSGGATVRYFEASYAAQAAKRREMELHLRRAMSLKELSLSYQPQLRLPDGEICGFEALIRWNAGDRGAISPAEFIPVAEEIGEIHAIGEWVLRTACAEAMKWPDHLVVAVNVSARQLESDSFLGIVRDALRVSGLPADRLELEITESVLLQDTQRALTRLSAIKELGVRIAMDDFGTGYSSLSSLNSFPFSSIKIDQSFVRGEQNERSRKLVSAILALGSSLGMTTIAEGVETPAQMTDLENEGCEEVQGYLIGKPMPPADIEQFLSQHHPTPSSANQSSEPLTTTNNQPTVNQL